MDKDNEELKSLAWFGIRADTGRPILERNKTNPCKKCNGFGTYGMPLCGAFYTCDECKGTGIGADNLKEKVVRMTRRGFFQKIKNFFT